MVKFAVLASGGALGACLRYIVSGIDYKFAGEGIPVGTWVVNLSGCRIIGLLWGISEKIVFSHHIRLFAFAGVLGGFTTFSTFALESTSCLRAGDYKTAFLNVALSNVAGIAFVFIGFFLSKIIISLISSI